MSLSDLGIHHKRVAQTLAASMRVTLPSREELPEILAEMGEGIPAESIAGPPFSIIQFVTSVKGGLDAEIGFPLRHPVDVEGVVTQRFPALETLSLLHTGPLDGLSESYGTLYGAAAAQGLISDEFVREVYAEWPLREWNVIEVQFVLHDWGALFVQNLDRVLDTGAGKRLMEGLRPPTTRSTLDERFQWVAAVLDRLESLAPEDQVYDIVSRCAHVFPTEQIGKLRSIYEAARDASDDPLEAVDAVIAFMGEDPGWAQAPRRKGHIVYATKAPRDPQAFEEAKTEADRGRAYCFCPIVRNRLDQGMPASFCYCGAGWYQQQWEGAVGREVSIEIVRSVLRGDEACEFAVRLPADL